MSDAPHHAAEHASDEAHEGPIKTPKQLVWTVVLSFVVPVIVIILLVNSISGSPKPSAGSDGLSDEAVARRIAPVAKLEFRDATSAAALRTGEQVYQAQCVACHAAGVAGSPKLGDAAAWAPRIKTGYEALLTSALKGKGAMAAQGGGDFSDFEIGRAVVYMANGSGGQLAEPKAPAAAASAPAEPAPAASAAAAAPVAAPAATAADAAPAATTAAATTAVAAAAAAVPVTASADAGKATYEKVCVACHAAGVANAPKFGDKAAWAPRVAAGVDAMTASVIKGKGAMPPKGGSTASDAELRQAVEYMVAAAK
jgi:cytochrome c5